MGITQEQWADLPGEAQLQALQDHFGQRWAMTYVVCALRHAGLVEWAKDDSDG